MLPSSPATPPGLLRLIEVHRAFCKKKKAQREHCLWLLQVAEEIDACNRLRVADANDTASAAAAAVAAAAAAVAAAATAAEHNRWLLRVSAGIDSRAQTDAILSDSDLD